MKRLTLLLVMLAVTAFVSLGAVTPGLAQDYGATVSETLKEIGDAAATAAKDDGKDAAAQAKASEEAIATAVKGAFGGRDAYVFNTLLFLVGGFLVMWMAAGFAMLEAGMVRTKNVAMQCTKNIALYSISGLMFWLIGYNLMYPGDGAWIISDVIGTIAPESHPRSRQIRSRRAGQLFRRFGLVLPDGLLRHHRLDRFRARWPNASSCGRS